MIFLDSPRILGVIGMTERASGECLLYILTFFILIAPVLQTVEGTDGDTSVQGRPFTGFPAEVRSTLSSPDEWPMYMGDSNHTGFSPSPVPMDNSTLWSKTITGLKETDSPIVYGGLVFIGSGDGFLRGFDPDTGAVIWDHYLGGFHLSAAPTAHEGVLYTGGDNGYVYAVDIESGSTLWGTNLLAETILSSPVVGGDKLFIGTSSLENSSFFAIYRSNGTICWNLSMGFELNGYGFQGTPVFWNDRVYIGDGWGTVYCLDAEGFRDGENDGQQAEQYTGPNGSDIIWKKEDPGGVYIGSPMLADGKLFIGNNNGLFQCLDAGTGNVIWNSTVGSGPIPRITSCPSYRDGIVYVTTKRSWGPYGSLEGGAVIAMDADSGSAIWRFNLTVPLSASSPVLGEGVLLFGGRDRQVHCLSTTTENIADEKREIWSVHVGAPLKSTFAVAMGRVFVSVQNDFTNGRLMAFGTPDLSITSVSISDPAPFDGESVLITAEVKNNGTVDARYDIEFIISTLNFAIQKEIGMVTDLYVPRGESRAVEIGWSSETGFPLIVARLKDIVPEEKDPLDNLASIEVYVRPLLQDYWTEEGGGPSRAGHAGSDLQSNRTFWELDLAGAFEDTIGSIWETSVPLSTGTTSATGGIVYLVGPAGNLLAVNTTAEENGHPGVLWSYDNASVAFKGRPALYIEDTQSWSFPNKVFTLGDDNSLWAFDWIGMWDGKNEGEYQAEERTGLLDGDVLWRAQLTDSPVQNVIISGGNAIVHTSDGWVSAYEDDTGALSWRVPVGELVPMASTLRTLYLLDDGAIKVVSSQNGSIMRSYAASDIISGDLYHVAVIDDMLILSGMGGAAALDLTPDDNGDGVVDGEDSDDGLKDNSSVRDIIWEVDVPSGMICPPTICEETGVISILTSSSLYIHGLHNGSRVSNLTFRGTPLFRPVSAGSSYYLFSAYSPFLLTAYIHDEVVGYMKIWELELVSEPMGPPSIGGAHMYVTLKRGDLLSIGDVNNAPTPRITNPVESDMFFPEEEIMLDASQSTDMDGDRLSYVWTLLGSSEILYEGDDPQVPITLSGVGKKTLVLRVYDEMRSYGESRVNVTVLKRVTSPDFEDPRYGIYTHLSYGITDPNGQHAVNISVPDKGPKHEGAVFICHLEFTPLPKSAGYRFEWANVTIDFADKPYPEGVDLEGDRIRVFHYDGSEWIAAPESGVLSEEKMAFGNFTLLKTGYYALGILDDLPPELQHRPDDHVEGERTTYVFTVQYRDADGDVPVSVSLHIEGSIHSMTPAGVLDPLLFNRFTTTSLQFSPGTYTYHFEASDGNFMVYSEEYTLVVENSAPNVVLKGPTTNVKVDEEVLFDATESSDPDGDPLEFIWDFDDRDGLQRDMVGSKVVHRFTNHGSYRVTLRVTDGKVTVNRTMLVTVERSDSEGKSPLEEAGIVIAAALVLMILIGIVAFFAFNRSFSAGAAEPVSRESEEWVCPECGAAIPKGVDECMDCGYVYDPIDFEKDELEEGDILKEEELEEIDEAIDEM